jgi:hypothetical protein
MNGSHWGGGWGHGGLRHGFRRDFGFGGLYAYAPYATRTIRTLTLTALATATPTAGSRSSPNAKAAALSRRGGFPGSQTFSKAIVSFALEA